MREQGVAATTLAAIFAPASVTTPLATATTKIADEDAISPKFFQIKLHSICSPSKRGERAPGCTSGTGEVRG